MDGIIATVIVGLIAGWLASLIVGGPFGVIGDIIVGVIGSVIGSKLFGMLGISIGGGWINAIITGTVGAIVLLLIIRLFKKAT